MSLDFFAEGKSDSNEPALNNNINRFYKALESNTIYDLILSENDFEALIEYFISIDDLINTEICSELAFTQHPYSSKLFVHWADTLILSGKVEKSLSILEKYRDVFSNCAAMYIVFARAYIKSTQFNLAKESYKRAQIYIEDKIERYEFTYSLVLDCIEVKEYNRAIYYLNELESLDSTAHEYYNDYAFCFDKINNSNKAIEYYNKYLDADPFNDIVWFNLGTIYAKELDYDKAIESYEYSIALNSSNDSSLFNLALVFMNLGRFLEAIKPLKECIELDNSSIDTYISLGEAYIGLNDLSLAKEAYRSALDIDSQHIDASISFKCIIAIEEYLSGNSEKALEVIISLTERNYNAISRIYGIYPKLANDDNFMNLLLKIKK